MEALSVLSRCAVGGIFLVASFTKIPTWSMFPGAVARLVPMGKETAKAAAVAIIAGELAVGCLLVTGVATKTAAVAAVLLLATFAITLTLNIFAGKEGRACGCFGAGSRISWAHVLRNVALAMLASISLVPDATSILAFASVASFCLSFLHRLRVPPTPAPNSTSGTVRLVVRHTSIGQRYPLS